MDFAAAPVGETVFPRSRDAAADLARARRRSRITLAVLWLAFLCGTSLWSVDMTLGVLVLLLGISTLLESVHGALGFDRLLRRALPRG